MSSLSRELVFLILQFLDEEKFKETVHKLEQESGFYFNMKYFEEEVHNGSWDEVERYLSGFTKVDDNRYSMKIFFEIRKQKYLEALDKHDRAKAVEILAKDLKVFATFNEELFKEITHLLTLENFRENEQLSKYGDTKSARAIMLVELKKLIEANPLFRDKLQFPNLKNSRLRTLINQSLNWQHQLCKSPRPNPDIKTLFVDHSCGQPNGARAPSPANNPLLGSIQKAGGFPPLGAHGPFQPTPAQVPAPLAGWMSNPSTVTHPAVSGGAIGLGGPSITAALKHPRTPPTNPSVDFPSVELDHMSKRTRPMGISDEVNLPVNVLPVTFPGQGHGHSQAFNAPDDLPKSVIRTLNQGSSPMSMDFHPVKQTLLLVGTNVGDIGLWEVCSRERLVLRNFKVWDLSTCSMQLQGALVKDPGVSVNRIIWSPDGSLFGVAYSRHIVQIYSYHGGDDVRQHLEIDAHVGGVNDLAFSHPNKQLCVITCGDDKTIKVWDAATGAKQYTFEGHEAPVYSVCPHYKENIQFIFSTSLDGKIKAWFYDNLGSRVDYDAPGRWCTTMAYSADGTRLFSCGTSKDGESYIVEWIESEGDVKRTYQGFRKRSLGVVQFDTTKNRFLAAGDDFSIKFWDMDNVQLLTTIDADGGLPASPRIRFNKDGALLAVSANENGIKILANSDGVRLLRTVENLSYDGPRASEAATKPAINPISAAAAAASSAAHAERSASMTISGMNGDFKGDVKPRITEESNDKSKIWKLTEITEPSQCRSLKLPEHSRVTKISRLIYTNSGHAILALAANAIHLLWKWQRSDRNSNGKATANVAPQLWQPSSGILMTNDITDTNPEEVVPCFALSKNDSYVMSASGGKISLFNMMTFKTMTTFMPPPPAATFLAFHPQDNNIIAIGMDDNTIQIYNVRVDEVKSKLKGHSKRITGLAFSHVLGVLISSGADAQICVWTSDGWEKQKSRFLQLPAGRTPSSQSDTRVQFHQDQIHFLVVHETQLAIFETTKLECVKQWAPRESNAPISHATFSCDSQLVYACFLDASVSIFSAANLRLRCRIAPSCYLPASVRNSNVHPLVIAAHPQEPNQFALGLSDGGVHVFEPLESEGKWGVPPPAENGSPSSVPTTPAGGASGSDQVETSQVAQLLNDTFSSDGDTVRTATEALDRLSLLPHFPSSLLSIATGGANQGQKVAAATYLKNFTRRNIEGGASNFEVSKEFKDQLMRTLLQVEPVVLKVLVEVFRAIVVSEFVKENTWPELVPELCSAIQTSNLISNGVNCGWSTVNALSVLQALIRPFQYFLNPKVAKEPVPPQLELIAKDILVPLLALFHLLVGKVLATQDRTEAETEKVLLLVCKCMYCSVRSYMPSTLAPILPAVCRDLIGILGSLNFGGLVNLEDGYVLRLKTAKRSLLIFCALVTRHRKYSDKLMPDIINCVLNIVKYSTNISKLDCLSERVISLSFDVIARILETGPGWRIVSPHFSVLLDSAIFPALAMNEKDISEWEEDADEYIRKNLPSDLEEVSGWREDLYTARKSAMNLLGVISMSKGPPIGNSSNGFSASSKRKKGEKNKSNKQQSSMGELLVLPYLSKFPIPSNITASQTRILIDYFGVLMAYGSLQDFLREQKPGYTVALVQTRILPLYRLSVHVPYLIATANWVLGELASCLPEEMSTDVYSSLMKALGMLDTEDTSCYPVRASAAGAIAGLLENDYPPPEWSPLLQAVIGRIGSEDEESSILFELLSSVVEVGNENVKEHIPYIVSSLVDAISKCIPPHPSPWPQVVERGFAALAVMAQSWESYDPEEAELKESSDKWASGQAAIGRAFSTLLQQAWFTPIRILECNVSPSTSCIEDSSALLRSIVLSVTGSNDILQLKVSELLSIWADLIADWHAWEESEDLLIFDCIKEVVILQSKCGLKNFIVGQMTPPPAPPVSQRSVIEGIGSFVSEAILQYPSAIWRACACVHILLHVPSYSFEAEGVKQSLAIAFSRAAFSRFRETRSQPCALWKPLLLAISSCYVTCPDIVAGVLEKDEVKGVALWVSALGFVCTSSFEPGLSAESEIKLIIMALAKVVEQLLALGNRDAGMLRDCFISLMEASVQLKDVQKEREEEEEKEEEEDNNDEEEDENEDDDDETEDDEDSEEDELEETEAEFLDRYAKTALALEEGSAIEEGDEEDQDHEIELGRLEEVDGQRVVGLLIERYHDILVKGQVLPAPLISSFLTAFPEYSLFFQQSS